MLQLRSDCLMCFVCSFTAHDGDARHAEGLLVGGTPASGGEPGN